MQFNNPSEQKMKTKSMTILHFRKSMGRSPSRLGSPSRPAGVRLHWAFAKEEAVNPSPGGFYDGQNTALGFSGPLRGNQNTAIGFRALFRNTGDANTATGNSALLNNVNGIRNTANGQRALETNTSGGNNTAIGWQALNKNRIASGRTGHWRSRARKQYCR